MAPATLASMSLPKYSATQGVAQYSEAVNGREMSGAEIIQLAAQQYSVGPRVLLALLELRGGWLSNPAPGPTADISLATIGPRIGAGLYIWLLPGCQCAQRRFLWLVP